MVAEGEGGLGGQIGGEVPDGPECLIGVLAGGLGGTAEAFIVVSSIDCAANGSGEDMEPSAWECLRFISLDSLLYS